GKATEITKNMAKQGESQFEEGNEGRAVSVEYWKRRIRSGIEHIHAIAPNMYCTHSSCGMRISVDLSDCVDCGFDIFEFATYAESVRKEAEIALHLADELGELNPPTIARQVVQIRSAEKLMMDMDVPFEPVEIPKEWEDLVIHWEAA
nr:site-specific integrase [Vibrio anguillarum]